MKKCVDAGGSYFDGDKVFQVYENEYHSVSPDIFSLLIAHTSYIYTCFNME